MSSSLTSTVISSGMAVGSTEMFSSCVGWLRMPPISTPWGVPSMCTRTTVLIGWSSRTSWKSMCTTRSRTGSSCSSLITTEWLLPLPSTVRSMMACVPPGPDTAVRRSRMPTQIAVAPSLPLFDV